MEILGQAKKFGSNFELNENCSVELSTPMSEHDTVSSPSPSSDTSNSCEQEWGAISRGDLFAVSSQMGVYRLHLNSFDPDQYHFANCGRFLVGDDGKCFVELFVELDNCVPVRYRCKEICERVINTVAFRLAVVDGRFISRLFDEYRSYLREDFCTEGRLMCFLGHLAYATYELNSNSYAIFVRAVMDMFPRHTRYDQKDCGTVFRFARMDDAPMRFHLAAVNAIFAMTAYKEQGLLCVDLLPNHAALEEYQLNLPNYWYDAMIVKFGL